MVSVATPSATIINGAPSVATTLIPGWENSLSTVPAVCHPTFLSRSFPSFNNAAAGIPNMHYQWI